MKIKRTFRIKPSTLKLYYYLRASIKVKQNSSKTTELEEIIQLGCDYIKQLEKDNKQIIIGQVVNANFVIGGSIDKNLSENLDPFFEKRNWRLQEGIEACIYYCAVSLLSPEETQFFKLDKWKITNI